MARLNKARLERTEWLYIDYWRATIWHQLARKTEINTARDEQTLNSGERSQTIRSGRGSNEWGGGTPQKGAWRTIKTKHHVRRCRHIQNTQTEEQGDQTEDMTVPPLRRTPPGAAGRGSPRRR